MEGLNIRLILLLGLVSLFADWLYEGMRAAAPQYLAYLGASAAFVGFVFGLGDALGYAARFVTGPLADKRGGYWLETFLGYGLQVGAVAGLVFARDVWHVAALIFLERFSKALRTPARDVIIASAGGKGARGRAFGIHAALDQIGAVAGAVTATTLLYLGHTPRDVFAVVLIPGVVALGVLYLAYKVGNVKPTRRAPMRGELANALAFGAAQFFLGLSLVHISLFMYKTADVAWVASLLYLVAMVAEIPLSVALGHLYDRSSRVVYAGPLLAALLALCFIQGGAYYFVGAVLYASLTAYADIVAKAYASKLGGATSLGVVNSLWGLGLMLGGILYGYYLDIGLENYIVAVALLSSTASLTILRLLYSRIHL